MNFKVTFRAVARSLQYKDEQGELVFAFDVGSKFDFKNPTGPGRNSLFLEHYSPQTQRVPRYRLAFERTKQFLESRGYQVEVHGDFVAPSTTTPSEITAVIQAELAEHQLPRTFTADIRSCLLTPARSEFKLHPENTVWDMWLVFEEPVHRLRIVFDEHSKQFGVADQNVFYGFYGGFIQTLDAVSKVA